MNTIGKNYSSDSGSKDIKGLRGTSLGGSLNGAGTATNSNAIRQTAAITGNMLLAKMLPGTTFSGDIIDVRGSAIKILMADDKTLEAASADSKNLNIGDHITFNVTSNNGKTVVIKPLKINNFNTNVLLKALEAAEVPVNDKNVSVVKAMMQHEMSIDKNSVADMIKKVEGFITETPEDIVAMERHNIPITQENINQFEAYKNCEHRILAQTETIAKEIPEFLKIIAKIPGEVNEVSKMAEKLIKIIADDNVGEFVNGKQLINSGNEGMVVKKNVIVSEQEATALSPEDEAFLNKMGISDDDVTYTKEGIKYTPADANIPVKEQLTKEQVLTNLKQLEGQELTEFIDSKEFREFVKDKVSKTFELDINKLGNDDNEIKENVKRLYERLENKSEELLNLSQNTNFKENNLNQTVSNMRNNLQFMQDLSSMAAYIQLPVKLNESKAHGELYVFNKKKGKPQDKDIVTAFLHLDLDNLGATDINVTLERKALKTEFSISDKDSLRIIEEHLEELKARLEKRGFIATITTALETKDSLTPFDKVLETDKPQISIKRYSFDVRA